MNDELFDVVDEYDVVQRQAPRSLVHAERLIHRATHVFVFRSDGRLVIHKRADDKEEFPGVWTSSASGHVSAGEDYDIAARRELFEELGLRAELTRLNKFSPSQETCLEHTVLYEAISDDPLVVDHREIADVDEIEVSELRDQICDESHRFSPAFRLLFAWYCENQLP